MLTLIAIPPLVNLKQPELRDFAMRMDGTEYTRFYIAEEDGKDVGFLAVDLRDDLDALVLYNIFVPKDLRHRGIGSKIISEAEMLARCLGFKQVFLSPTPMEHDYPESDLIRWYINQGYSERPDCPSELRKMISI